MAVPVRAKNDVFRGVNNVAAYHERMMQLGYVITKKDYDRLAEQFTCLAHSGRSFMLREVATKKLVEVQECIADEVWVS